LLPTDVMIGVQDEAVGSTACVALAEAAGLNEMYSVLEELLVEQAGLEELLAEQAGLEESLEVQGEPAGLLEVLGEVVRAVMQALKGLRQGRQALAVYPL